MIYEVHINVTSLLKFKSLFKTTIKVWQHFGLYHTTHTLLDWYKVHTSVSYRSIHASLAQTYRAYCGLAQAQLTHLREYEWYSTILHIVLCKPMISMYVAHDDLMLATGHE